MALQAGLCLAWSEAPEDTFCRVEAHLYSKVVYSYLIIYVCIQSLYISILYFLIYIIFFI